MTSTAPKNGSAAGEHLGDVQLISAPPSSMPCLDSAAIFAPLEAPDYLVEGIIRRGSLTEIVAYGASGKTWLIVNMLLSICAGEPWLGKFSTKPGRALLLDYESGPYEARRRFQANARAIGCGPVDGLGLVSMPSVYMNSPEFATHYPRLAAKNDLIVIDSLRAANPGVDENDSKIRAGLDEIRRLGEPAGCANVVLCHAKKITGGRDSIDPREAGRGSSAIFDAADTVFHVTLLPGQPLLVTQTKARFGKVVPPFQVSIEDGMDGAVHVWATDADPPVGDDEFEQLCDSVFRVVSANPGTTQAFVASQVKKRVSAVRAALQALAAQGRIHNSGSEKAGMWTSL